MHKACLDILQRLCQIRQAQNQGPAADMPKTLEAFCDAFQQRRRKNLNDPDKSMDEDYYYAKSGGIEWSHDYYGARQFWADEWNTEPGWEVGWIIIPQRPTQPFSVNFYRPASCYAPTPRQGKYLVYNCTLSPSSSKRPP